jgi:hypothetical protein
MKLQKLGGYAALISIGAHIAVIISEIIVQKRFGDELSGPVERMAAWSTSPTLHFMLTIEGIICIAFSILWLIVFFALHERMQSSAPHLTRIGLISASTGTAISVAYFIIRMKGSEMIFPTQDISAFRAWDAIAGGLQSMSYHAYGWAFLLIGYAIVKTSAFSRIPGWLLFLAGIIWIWTPIAGPGFMIYIPYSLIAVSFAWIGIVQLRPKPLN